MMVSVFDNNHKLIKSVPIEKVIDSIKTGSNQDDFFAPGGVVRITKKRRMVILYSSLVIINFDLVSSEDDVKLLSKIRKLETTFFCYTCIKVRKIFVGIRTNSIEQTHKDAIDQVIECYNDYLQVESSQSNNEITFLQHLSHDQTIFYNEHAKIFVIDADDSKIKLQEHQDDDMYWHVFNEQIEYTENLIPDAINKRNQFLYTLGINCAKVEIPINRALSLSMKLWGYDIDVKRIITKAYRELKDPDNSNLGSVFSIYFLNLGNYKDTIPLDERVFFEALIYNWIVYKKAFYYTTKAIKKELGINRARKDSIVSKFIERGFLLTFKHKQEGHQFPVVYFDLNLNMLPKAAEEMMDNSRLFIEGVNPLLKHGYNGGYLNI